jgi:diacylglycerol kinase (ATP)
VHLARAREVEVELAEEVPAHIDGEILAPTRAFRARVLPGALRVVAP